MEIRLATRRQFAVEEKIRIVLSGLRGEDSIAKLCRREGIVQDMYYRWSKEFLEAGKKRLPGDTARAATSEEVKELRREASALKEVVAELTLENRLLKKSAIGVGEDGAEKLEDHPAGRASPLPVRHTLAKLGIPRATFYRWYDRYSRGGPEALTAGPDRIASGTAFRTPCTTTSFCWHSTSRRCRRASWRALHRQPELFRLRGFGLPPAEGARPDRQSSLHRDQGGRCVQGQDHRPNQLWQTDFTYLKVIGCGWFYLSTVLDDFSRYILAWKLCTSMRPEDVTATLDRALRASGLDQAKPADRPRLSDNGSSYIAGDLAKWLNDRNIKHAAARPIIR